MKVSKNELYQFFTGNHDELSPTALAYLTGHKEDIQHIIADFSMSENHIGGDDIISYINQVLGAIADKKRVVAWYGEDTEVLVLAIREDLFLEDFSDWDNG